MELVSFGKEMLQNIAEHVASYRFGQSVLRQLDRTLWVVEKCARWAVPPPLDQDERPQPELVRPLPWVFFLMMLIALRVARETISLANLIMGKPPLRSADVVMFIQSKRRYLRTLKYQGNRMMRARSSSQSQQPWYSGLYSLFQLTMCFRHQSQNYGNNNTTPVTNNDEVMVVKRNKRGRQEEGAAASAETTMDRLIEKMMLDLDAESDEDSSYTLTNVTSTKSNGSECTESDQDTLCNKSNTPTKPNNTDVSQTNGDDIHFSPNKNEISSSTPEKDNKHDLKENHTEDNNVVTNEIQTADSEIPDSKNAVVDNLDSENEVFENAISENSSPENQDSKNAAVENTDFENATSKISDSVKTIDENSSTDAGENSKLNKNITSETTDTENSVSDTTNSDNKNSESLTSKTCEEAALPLPKEPKTLSLKEETQNFITRETSHNSQRTKKDHKIANGRTVKSVPSKKKGVHRERRDSNEARQQRAQTSNTSY